MNAGNVLENDGIICFRNCWTPFWCAKSSITSLDFTNMWFSDKSSGSEVFFRNTYAYIDKYAGNISANDCRFFESFNTNLVEEKLNNLIYLCKLLIIIQNGVFEVFKANIVSHGPNWWEFCLRYFGDLENKFEYLQKHKIIENSQKNCILNFLIFFLIYLWKLRLGIY